jgi:hypothetical protein
MNAGGAGGATTGGGGAAGKGGSGTGQGGNATGGASGSGGSAGMATAGMGGGGTPVVDAGVDAPMTVDAGPKLRIRCGTTSCDPTTHFCCLDEPRVCLPIGSDACPRNRDRLHCDDESDCDANQHCCVVDNNNGNPNDAVCRDNCPSLVGGRPAQILCDPTVEGQCPNSDPFCSLIPGAILATYAFCH